MIGQKQRKKAYIVADDRLLVHNRSHTPFQVRDNKRDNKEEERGERRKSL